VGAVLLFSTAQYWESLHGKKVLQAAAHSRTEGKMSQSCTCKRLGGLYSTNNNGLISVFQTTVLHGPVPKLFFHQSYGGLDNDDRHTTLRLGGALGDFWEDSLKTWGWRK